MMPSDINKVKVPISRGWREGERVSRGGDSSYAAVNLCNIEPDSAFMQQTLLAPLPKQPRRFSFLGAGPVLYLAGAAVAAAWVLGWAL